MKIDRLMGIVTILLQQDKVTAPELAWRFEVSRRTINRDIEDICRAGIPLVTIFGYQSGPQQTPAILPAKSKLSRSDFETKCPKDTICKQFIQLEEFRNFQSVDNREPSRSLYCLKTGLDGQHQLYYAGL